MITLLHRNYFKKPYDIWLNPFGCKLISFFVEIIASSEIVLTNIFYFFRILF
jgi:hypothetical protein